MPTKRKSVSSQVSSQTRILFKYDNKKNTISKLVSISNNDQFEPYFLDFCNLLKLQPQQVEFWIKDRKGELIKVNSKKKPNEVGEKDKVDHK